MVGSARHMVLNYSSLAVSCLTAVFLLCTPSCWVFSQSVCGVLASVGRMHGMPFESISCIWCLYFSALFLQYGTPRGDC